MGRPRLQQPRYRLRKLPSGQWGIFWTERGRTRRLSTGTTDAGAAEIYLQQFVAGRLKGAPGKTVKDMLEGYQKAREGKVASGTLGFCVVPLVRGLGDIEPDHISDGVVDQYARQRGRAPGTIIRELGTLRAALRWAERNGWGRMPQFRMPVPHPAPRDRWLTREEAQKLLDACKAPHIRLFILMGLGTAARKGAILGLTWDRVDLEKGIIDYGPGRGKKRRAVVPINATLKAALQEAHSVRTTDHVIEFRGRPLTQIDFGFNATVERAGLKDVSPHVLRHTAATWMVMAGTPLAEVARFLGDSERMVERVYGKHSPDFLRGAARALEI